MFILPVCFNIFGSAKWNSECVPAFVVSDVFFSIDKDRTGFIDKVRDVRWWCYLDNSRLTACSCSLQDELKHFVYHIWDELITSNLHTGLNYLEQHDDGDGQFDFEQVWHMHSLFPNLFYPVMKLQVRSFCIFQPITVNDLIHNADVRQTQMQEAVFGVEWWEHKKLELTDNVLEKRLAAEAKTKSRQKATKDAEGGANDSLVRSRMGVWYYLTPWRRERARKMIERIAAIDSALEAEEKLVDEQMSRRRGT